MVALYISKIWVAATAKRNSVIKMNFQIWSWFTFACIIQTKSSKLWFRLKTFPFCFNFTPNSTKRNSITWYINVNTIFRLLGIRCFICMCAMLLPLCSFILHVSCVFMFGQCIFYRIFNIFKKLLQCKRKKKLLPFINIF